MGRKKSISRDLVADVFRRLMIAIDDPASAMFPGPILDVNAELAGLDEFLDSLPTTAARVAKPTLTAKPPKPVSGTRPISIRLHLRVINAFKAEAIRTGTSYQTLMHRALADATEEFAL